MMPFWPVGILAKLLAAALVPMLLLAGLLSLYIVNARLDDLDQAFRERGRANAEQMAANALLGLFTGDRRLLEAAGRDHLARDPDIVGILVRNASGEVVARAVRRGAGETAGSSEWFTVAVQRPTVQIGSHEALARQAPLGEVAVSLSNHDAGRAAGLIVRNAVLISVAAVLLTVFLVSLIGRQIVRPIQRLRRAVNQVREGDFTARVAQTSHGEIGDLEAGFNTMAEAIASAADESQREVARATSDLQQTMDALEVRNIELDIARKRAIAASAAKSEFLASMSHEIRTPMNGVLGFADLLRKTRLDDVQHGYVETIKESARALLTNLNGILDFSKMEAGKLTLEQRPFSVREVVGDAVRLFGALAHNKGLGLAHEFAESVPDRLIGDAVRLRQILYNLIGNSVKFTERGGVDVSVNCIGRNDQAVTLEFVVRDSGIGIPADRLDQLFQPFTQGHVATSRLYGGTGLGLSISRRLAEAMGGEIGASSSEGEGSVFVAEIPFRLAAGAVAGVVDSTVSLHPDPGPRRLEGRRFLIADDNPINLDLLDALLANHGASVIRAADGEQAVRKALSNDLDIAFIDIHMPRRDGIAATQQIHAVKPELPVVALTADVTQRARWLSGSGAQFIDCLIKPLDEAALCATIAQTLRLPRGWRADTDGQRMHDSPQTAVVVRDTGRAIAQAAGSSAIADALFAEFLTALPDALTGIDDASSAGDREALWQAAHRLQGAAATCSLPALHAALAELTRLARSADAAAIAAVIAEVHTQARRLATHCTA